MFRNPPPLHPSSQVWFFRSVKIETTRDPTKPKGRKCSSRYIYLNVYSNPGKTAKKDIELANILSVEIGKFVNIHQKTFVGKVKFIR